MDNQVKHPDIGKVYYSVKELYLSYCEDLEREKKRLQSIYDEIKETEEYLSYLRKHHNSDAFVFSPRGVISKSNDNYKEGLYDTGKVIDFSALNQKEEELERCKTEVSNCKNQIARLEETISTLDQNILLLKNISDLEQESEKTKEQCNQIKKEYETKEKKLIETLGKDSIEKLSHVLHMLDMTSAFIDNDPVRAKLELKNIRNNIQSTKDDLEQIAKSPEGDVL